ncbi:MAG: TolC family protein, partial [Bacteroidota bacterium]
MRNVVILLLLFCLMTVVVSAQPGASVLTLKNSVEIALDRNFTVKQAQNNLERDQAGVLSAYGNFLPSVNVSSTWGGSQGQSFLPNGQALPSTNNRSISSSVSAQMTLFDGFSNTSNLSSSVSTAISSEYTLSRTRQNVVNQTRRLYYDVLRTRRLLEVAEANLQYNAQQLDRVRETARLGSASLVNVYQQQSQVGQDELRMVQAQNEYELAQANLIAFLGLDPLQTFQIQDQTIPDEIDRGELEQMKELVRNAKSLVEQSYDRRPDYLSARQQYEATDAGVTIARSGYLPTITASTSYSLRGNSTVVNELGQRVSVNEFGELQNNRSFSWGITFSLPVFSGFRTNEQSQRALVARKNAEENVKET